MDLSDFLSANDIKAFTQRSDGMGLYMVACNWLMILLIFALVALWTHPITVALAIVLLGGRQLGLAVLMHEAGHNTLFKTPFLNQWIGQWVCALPVLGDCTRYAASHRKHHRTVGSHADPDLPNYQHYPIDKASFKRKLLRDVSGRTGIKLLVGLVTGGGRSIMMRAGEKTAIAHGILVNVGLFALLLLVQHPSLYGLWVVAYLTTYPLFARIRQVAEHGAVDNLFAADSRLNTRTTLPRWYERIVLCPNYVNYHLEHHLLASVPCYRLPRLHQHLLNRGFFTEHPQSRVYGYWGVLKQAVPELGSATIPAA